MYLEFLEVIRHISTRGRSLRDRPNNLNGSAWDLAIFWNIAPSQALPAQYRADNYITFFRQVIDGGAIYHRGQRILGAE